MNSQKEAKETIRLERLTFDLKNVIKEFKNTKSFNVYTTEATEYRKVILQSETYRLSNVCILQHDMANGKTLDYFLVCDYEIVMQSNTNIGEFVLTTNPNNEKENYIVLYADDPIVDTLFYPIDYDLLELFRNSKVKNKNKTK